MDVKRRWPELAMMLTGGASIAFALLGLWYNSSTIFDGYFKFGTQEPESEEFYAIFYFMSSICLGFFLALVVTGVQLIRRKIGWAFGLLAVVVLECMYVLAVGSMWRHPTLGHNIAAASGISSGGLSFQLLALFPLWGPAIALWSRAKLARKDNRV